MLSQINAANTGEIDLVQDGVIGFSKAFLIIAINFHLNACLCSELCIMLRLHDVIGLRTEAVEGETMQCAEVREVGLCVEARELRNRSVPRFVSRLSSERKVTDSSRENTVGQLLLYLIQ